MSGNGKSLCAAVAYWVAGLGVAIRAAFLAAAESDSADLGGRTVDSEFEGWLSNDPTVTADPVSRYHHGSPGYLTRNGRGSLEVGAADDSKLATATCLALAACRGQYGRLLSRKADPV